MNSVESVRWDNLLDTNGRVRNLVTKWAVENLSTDEVEKRLSFSPFAGEFRNVVRTHGTTYGRRLARKALTYREVLV